MERWWHMVKQAGNWWYCAVSILDAICVLSDDREELANGNVLLLCHVSAVGGDQSRGQGHFQRLRHQCQSRFQKSPRFQNCRPGHGAGLWQTLFECWSRRRRQPRPRKVSWYARLVHETNTWLIIQYGKFYMLYSCTVGLDQCQHGNISQCNKREFCPQFPCRMAGGIPPKETRSNPLSGGKPNGQKRRRPTLVSWGSLFFSRLGVIFMITRFMFHSVMNI